MALQPLYTAHATATSGRDGHAETSDGNVKVDLTVPKEMGGAGKPGATNPEQLFAIGYAACFGGMVAFMAGKRKQPVKDVQVTSHVTISKNDSGDFGLSVDLQVHIPNVEREQAEKLVEEAHEACPYSRATRGNVDVKLSVV